MLVVHWNGIDLPAELRSLPAGDYVIEPAEQSLSAAEEASVRAGLDDVRNGRIVSHEELKRRYAEKRAR